MGKRKQRAKKPKRPRKSEPLASTFDCLFCHRKKSVTVKLDKKAGVGHLFCSVCGETFQSPVNNLSAAVDVYSDWLDACNAVTINDAKRN